MTADEAVRQAAASSSVPVFDDPAWTPPPPLREATVALVTTAALHRDATDAFAVGDAGYRILDRAERHLRIGHFSPNFDRSGFGIDLNVVYPIDRLEELAARGEIGAVAPRHLSFAGNQPDELSAIRLDSGPAAAALLKEDGVDVVLLTPV